MKLEEERRKEKENQRLIAEIERVRQGCEKLKLEADFCKQDGIVDLKIALAKLLGEVEIIKKEGPKTAEEVEMKRDELDVLNHLLEKLKLADLSTNKDSEMEKLMATMAMKTQAGYRDWETDRKSTRLNSSHRSLARMPSSA